MRTLIICALAAVLLGCSCPAPLRSDINPGVAAKPPTVEPKPAPSKLHSGPTATKIPVAAKKDDTFAGGFVERALARKLQSDVSAKAEPAASGPSIIASDPVIESAKKAVAEQMEDPASAEFKAMKRAMRKNTLGQPIDTICGYVKGKDLWGKDTGDRPFLYLVKENEAYVVVSRAESTASSVYNNICNSQGLTSQ